LLVVEGVSDIRFLTRLSRLVHAHDAGLPVLHSLEDKGQLLFVPIGGGDLEEWMYRLAPLGQKEFHLYDREVPPETDYRRSVAERINGRPLCRAVLTQRRALENYLHPEAIWEASRLHVSVDAHSDVPTVVAQAHLSATGGGDWESLPRRGRQRQRYRAKQWLTTTAVERMSIERLAEQDPQGEVIGWFHVMAQLLAEEN
jgi:hypothetical protein